MKKKRFLSGLLALVMVLAMLPGEAWAEDFYHTVSTLEELEEYIEAFKAGTETAPYVYLADGVETFAFTRDVTFPEGLSFCSVTGNTVNVSIQNNAEVTLSENFQVRALTIESGAMLTCDFLTCWDLYIYGTLVTGHDISCSGSFILGTGGHIDLGRTLTMSNMSKEGVIFSESGTITYRHTDNMGGVNLWYCASDETSFLDCLNSAANDSDAEHTYYIKNAEPRFERGAAIELTRDAKIPENTVVSIDPVYNQNTTPGLTIGTGAELVNNGSIQTNSLASTFSNIAVNGILINNKLFSICQSDAMDINGKFVNNASLLIYGDVTIHGSLENISGFVRVDRENDSEEGALTLGTGATYTGIPYNYGNNGSAGTIQLYYKTGNYEDFIIGFGDKLISEEVDISDCKCRTFWMNGDAESGTDIPDVPDPIDPPSTIKVLDLIPADGSQLTTLNTSSLDLRIVFDHNIENLNFKEGTLAIYEYNTDKYIYSLHPLPDGRPTSDVSFSYKDPRIMGIKTISNNLKLQPNTKYYVTLSYGFVNFEGTDDSISLKKGDWVFTTANAEYFSTTADIVFQNGYGIKNTTVSAQWDDAWFLNEATNVYNHGLATTSMALCGAAYASGADARNALEKFGFTYTKSYNYSRELSEDDCDYVGYTFGSKEIKYVNGETACLVAVIIRGTAGNEEWYSNFRIGINSDDHLGFSIAEQRLLEDLKAYLVDVHRGFPEAKVNNKFLITGHSRGAAVANLLAADLSYSDYATANNVYAYTFATPNVSTRAKTSGYENIFNIVIPEDFVPKLPLTEWGYKRYGVTLQLPSKSNYDSKKFTEVSGKMEAKFFVMTLQFYKKYAAGTQTVENVISSVYHLAPSVSSYYYAPRLTNVMGGITKVTTSYSYFHDAFAKMLVTGKLKDTLFFAEHIAGDFAIPTAFFIANGTDFTSILQSRAFCAHCPAGYFSWMSFCTPEELFGERNYSAGGMFKRLTIACPVDVFVYNEDGDLVASVVNEQVIENTLAVSAEEGRKMIDLPGDQIYTIEITATGDGEVSYTVEEIAISNGESDVQRTVRFNSIAIKAGDILRGTVDSIENTTIDRYTLIKNGSDPIQADYDSTQTPLGYPTVPVFPVSPAPSTPASIREENTDVPEATAEPETLDAAETPQTPAAISFTDVPASAWYYNAVQYVYEKGIMNGTAAALFSPDASTTRGMIVTILYRLEGEPAAGGSAFTDVPAGQWYTSAVGWAAANGIVDGYGDGRFGPGDTVTREQLAAILYRYTAFKGGDTSARADVGAYRDGAEISPYALEAICWAAAEGVINGFDDGRLAPRESASRAQVAQMLMNYLPQ